MYHNRLFRASHMCSGLQTSEPRPAIITQSGLELNDTINFRLRLRILSYCTSSISHKPSSKTICATHCQLANI